VGCGGRGCVDHFSDLGRVVRQERLLKSEQSGLVLFLSRLVMPGTIALPSMHAVSLFLCTGSSRLC
jgi:hypothetical protein